MRVPGAPVLLRAAGGQGAIREQRGRAPPPQAVVAATAAAGQRGTL